MDLCNHLCLASWLAILCGKNIKVEHYAQTFEQNSVMSAILINAIDL